MGIDTSDLQVFRIWTRWRLAWGIRIGFSVLDGAETASGIDVYDSNVTSEIDAGGGWHDEKVLDFRCCILHNSDGSKPAMFLVAAKR